MKRTVQLKDVSEAIKLLEERDEKVTCRSILAITGGGMSTVLKLKAEIDRQNALRLASPMRDISTFLTEAILSEIAQQVAKVTGHLDSQLGALEKREEELLAEFERVENDNQRLAGELLAAQNTLSAYRVETDKQLAVASSEVIMLNSTISGLQMERRQLIDAGEMARAETAKLLLQIERADLAAKKSDDQLQKLLVERVELLQSLQQSEKQAAVSNQKVEDLMQSISQMNSMTGELKAENRELASKLIEAQLKAAHAEKLAAVAEKTQELLQRSFDSTSAIHGIPESQKIPEETATTSNASEPRRRGRPPLTHHQK